LEFKTSENPYTRRDNPRKVVKKPGKKSFKKKFIRKKTVKSREHSRHK